MIINKKIVYQYIYLFVSILVGLCSLSKNPTIINNIILFLGILLFQLFINLLSKFKGRCELSLKRIIMKSINNSLYSILGHMFYNYLKQIKFINFITKSRLMESLLASLVITGTMFFISNTENKILSNSSHC